MATDVDEKMTHISRNFHMKNSYAQICRRVLFDRIFQPGLEFICDGRTLEMKPQFERLIRDFWIPFARDVMDEIWVRGFSPWMPVKMDGGDMVPVVPQGQHSIMITFDKKWQRYKLKYHPVEWTQSMSILGQSKYTKANQRRIKILSGYGFDPDERGKGIQPLTPEKTKRILYCRRTTIFGIQFNQRTRIRRNDQIV